MKRARYRLEDDVTGLNFELINRLINNEQIHSAWFFNGNVFTKTQSGKSVKFELFDGLRFSLGSSKFLL